MPEFPDFLPGEADEPRRWSGYGRWRTAGRSDAAASLTDLVARYEDLMRSAEEMREVGNTRMAEDFVRMAERVKNQVKGAQVAALENRAGPAGGYGGSALRLESRLARKPDGSWVEMPGTSPKIAGGVGELPVTSHKTPDFIRRLKGDSDLVKWLHGAAGGEAGGGPAEELVEEAVQSAFHIRQNPAENALIGVAEKYGNKYAPTSGGSLWAHGNSPTPVGRLMFQLRHWEEFGGAKYLDDTFPGLRQEKALVGKPGSGRWGFSVGELLDDIAKAGDRQVEGAKKALAFASMERFGHPEYAEQIGMVDEYIRGIGWDDYDMPGREVQLQEGLSKQLGRPDLHNKVVAAAPHRGGTQAGWMAAAEDSAYQLRQALGGLEPEYVSPTGPTGHRLSPLPAGAGPNFNLEMDPANWRTQPQLSPARGQMMPDDIMALANRQVGGGLGGAPDLGAQSTKDFWGGMWDDPRRPQPRSPAIGELMPGPKGGYPGGPPVGMQSARPGWITEPSKPARVFGEGGFKPLEQVIPHKQPYGHRVPGGVQLQMQFAKGKPIAMNGPVLSGFYKVFPGQSIKDAPQLLAKGATGMAYLLAKFGDDAVRLALKLPK